MKKSFCKILTCLLLVLPVTIFGQGQINGLVTYNNVNENPIVGATVTIYNQGGETVGQTITDEAGLYKFSSLPFGDYTIEVNYNAVAGGISLEDAFMVLQHIQGNIELTPLQFKAADVDINGIINMHDATEIIRRYVLQLLQFEQQWVFETKNITLTGNKDGDDDVEEDSYVRGSCTGDLNGSYSPPQTKAQNPDFSLTSETELTLASGEVIAIPLKFKNYIDVQGLGLILNYPEQVININNIEFYDPAFTYNLIDGQIRIGWVDNNCQNLTLMPEEVFGVIYISANPNAIYNENLNNNVFEFTLSNESEIVDNNNNTFTPEINLPKLIISDETKLISSVWPNPANIESNINYNLTKDGNIIIKLYDINGKEVKQIYNDFVISGSHSINFQTTDIENGNYFIHLYYKGKENKVKTDIKMLHIIK